MKTMLAMIAIVAVVALLPAATPPKSWRYELVSPTGTASFNLATMPTTAPVPVPKFEAARWYGQEVESIELDPVHREGRVVTIRLKDSERPLIYVFESFDVTTKNVKPRASRVGLRCTMAVSRP